MAHHYSPRSTAPANCRSAEWEAVTGAGERLALSLLSLVCHSTAPHHSLYGGAERDAPAVSAHCGRKLGPIAQLTSIEEAVAAADGERFC